MSVKVHPTAVLEGDITLEEGVEIGPYSYLSGEIFIGKGTKVGAYVRVEGRVRMGENNRIHHSVSIGGPPQDLSYRGEPSSVIIGNNNVIREFVSIHRATGEGEATVVGDDNYIMAYAHIAHNCRIGNHIVIANTAQLAGYVEVEDRAFISGVLGIHQFSRVGRLAMVGGMTRLNRDAPPYFITVGYDPVVIGPNLVGLRRAGFSGEDIRVLKDAYTILYRSSTLAGEALKVLEERYPENPHIRHLVAFFRESKRGVVLKSPA